MALALKSQSLRVIGTHARSAPNSVSGRAAFFGPLGAAEPPPPRSHPSPAQPPAAKLAPTAPKKSGARPRVSVSSWQNNIWEETMNNPTTAARCWLAARPWARPWRSVAGKSAGLARTARHPDLPLGRGRRHRRDGAHRRGGAGEGTQTALQRRQPHRRLGRRRPCRHRHRRARRLHASASSRSKSR